MNRKFKVLGLLVAAHAFCFSSLSAFGKGEDLVNAPPSFAFDGKKAVAVDFQTVKLAIAFDIAAKKAIGQSHIVFYSKEAGFPMLDLVPNATEVKLNGKRLEATRLALTPTPDKVTQVRVLTEMVNADSTNELDITYEMSPGTVTFSEDGVQMGFFMNDVSYDRSFLEKFAPSSFEFDHFAMEVFLAVKGGKRAERLFTNARVIESTRDTWHLKFPEYYTTSSFYLHLTDRDVVVKEEVFEGLKAKIPVTVYSDKETTTRQGMENAKKYLSELEGTYGPFAHEKVVIYITPSGGGMEYCGATMTSMGALGHELTHSWFARGYMPANGNAGWIDEAIASWRDNGYPTAIGAPKGPAVNLANFSPYRRTTPYAAYSDGMRLMSVFDMVFKEEKDGGLKLVLRDLFDQHKHQVITTPQFASWVEKTTSKDLKALFSKYVYGKTAVDDGEGWEMGGPNFLFVPGTPEKVTHPRPYTAAELTQFL